MNHHASKPPAVVVWRLFRPLLGVASLVMAAVLLIAQPGAAQDTVADDAGAAAAAYDVWPLHPEVNAAGEHDVIRGPGGYLSLTKIILLWLLIPAFAYSTTWVNQDVRVAKMPYEMWIPIVTFPFVFGFFLFGLLVPFFFIGYLLTLACYVAPLATYIVLRNQKMAPHERVLTPDHLRHVLAERLGKAGVKISAEKKFEYEKGAPVEIKATAAPSDQQNQANLIQARQSEGFVFAKNALAEALARRASRIMFDFTQTAAGLKYMIDGVWHDLPPLDRPTGDPLLAVLKKVCDLNPADRRSRQTGAFALDYAGASYNATLASQGTPSGERAVVEFHFPGVTLHTLEEIGLRDKVQEKWKELLGESSGLLLVSAMPGGGLSTTLHATLRATDRLMRDFISLQPVGAGETEVENVVVTPYDLSKGESPATILPKLLRKEPDVLVAPKLPDADSITALAETAENKLVVAAVPAKEACEAPIRLIAQQADQAAIAANLKAVLYVRLVRRLCDACKQAYQPQPEALRKLGLPPDKIRALYRPPQPNPAEEKPEICEKCDGLGYYGRTGVFELVVVNDKLRQVLQQKPQLELMRKVSRAAGNRSLQDEGILLAARGVTSIQEVMRALKG